MPHISDDFLPTTDLSSFRLDLVDHIAHLVLNRPDALNALNPKFWQELDQILDTLHRRGESAPWSSAARASIFVPAWRWTPSPTRTLPQRPHARRAGRHHRHAGPAAVNLQQARIPAHACDLRHTGRLRGRRARSATACIRYASREAFFCVQEINIGMTADLGSLQRLPKLMPLGIAKELAYTGRRMGAQEAANYGLVNAVTKRPRPRSLRPWPVPAKSQPPVAIWGSKQVINYARDHSVSDSLQQMGWVQSGIWSNRHVTEAVSAMQAKRAGDFPPLEPLSAWSASDESS